MTRRIVVTGIGLISPLGNATKMWEGLSQGVSGIDYITGFDTTEFTVKIGGEVVDFEPSDYMEKKDARRMDRFSQFAVAAAKQSIADAGLIIDKSNSERIGVMIGSGIGGITTLEQQARTFIEKGPSRVSPFFVPMLIPDMASGQVAIATGAKGPNACTVTACASGTHSIGDAFRVIANGHADLMLAGGSEAAVSPLAMAGFIAARALSTRNEDPKAASRPFDKDRDGFVMSEGSAVLVLENLQHAQERGAKIYGEVVGYGSTGDAYHITSPAPAGEGAQRAMKEALRESGLSPQDIDYINAHGTSTEYNDKFETAAIKQVFGDHADKLIVSSTKALTGHLLGASGALEAAISLFSLENQRIIGTFNLDNPDPECDLNYLPNQTQDTPLNYVMSNSFGFGGHNGVLVFKRWEK